MARSTISRRVSEFVGVALFAAALIWIVALASYDPTDPAWFFSTGLHTAPVNFAGRVGAARMPVGKTTTAANPGTGIGITSGTENTMMDVPKEDVPMLLRICSTEILSCGLSARI